MIVQTEDVPAPVPRTEVQHPHIKTMKNVSGLILSIGGPNGCFKSTSQVVKVEGGSWLREVRTEWVMLVCVYGGKGKWRKGIEKSWRGK